MRARVSSLTRSGMASARLTVEVATPASRATSLIVSPFGAARGVLGFIDFRILPNDSIGSARQSLRHRPADDPPCDRRKIYLHCAAFHVTVRLAIDCQNVL